MGFKHWLEGFIFVGMFLVVMGWGCFFVAVLGAKMINDLGNFPTKSAQIQMAASWKIILIEVVTFAALIALYAFLFYLNQ